MTWWKSNDLERNGLELCGSKACKWKYASISGISAYHIKVFQKHSLNYGEVHTDLASMDRPIHWNGAFFNWSIVLGLLVCLPNLNIRNRFDQMSFIGNKFELGTFLDTGNCGVVLRF